MGDRTKKEMLCSDDRGPLTQEEELKVLKYLRKHSSKQWPKKGSVLIELQEQLGIGAGAIHPLIEPSGILEDYQYVVSDGGWRSRKPFTVDLVAVEKRIAQMEEDRKLNGR